MGGRHACSTQLGTRAGRAPPSPPYQIMLDPSLQENYKTKMIQQEHHKTEYHLCEVMAGITEFLLVEYISAILFFFHLTYYKSNFI
jgi:hypothetical protein